MTTWDHTTDFLVVGSGAGGMTAAIAAHDGGLSTLVIEKSEHYGGSSAMSGGTVWIPNNHLMAATGIQDSEREAIEYLKAITRGRIEESRLRQYVEASREMLQYLDERTPVKFVALPEQCDYFPETAGGKPGSRSVEATPYSGHALGDEFANLRPPHPQELVLGRYCITGTEARRLVRGSWWIALWRMAVYFFNLPARLRGRRDDRLTLGNALMGRLRRALLDREIPLWLESRATELIVEGGRVAGAVIERRVGDATTTLRVRATKGVILAAGGFERNQEMRERFQAKPVSADWSAGNPHNTGDGIQLGQSVGGVVDLMDDAWWTPVTLLPGKDYAWILVVEKNLPGGILVNAAGRRFTNESAPYIEVVRGFYDDPTPGMPQAPCYLVFDGRYRRTYPLGPLPPGRVRPDAKLSRKYREGFFTKTATIRELAERLGIDGDGLEFTIARFNEFARTGRDLDYGRGESLYDRYYSDPKVSPNPSLAPLTEAPYYAVPVYPGDIGTKGGLRTDSAARVVDQNGQAILGLYATGNCMSSVMGNTYPGAGGTLGPSMTYGFLAARHAAAAEVRVPTASPAVTRPSRVLTT